MFFFRTTLKFRKIFMNTKFFHLYLKWLTVNYNQYLSNL